MAHGRIRGISAHIVNFAVSGQLHVQLQGLLEKKYHADSKATPEEIRPFQRNRVAVSCNTPKSASQRNLSKTNFTTSRAVALHHACIWTSACWIALLCYTVDIWTPMFVSVRSGLSPYGWCILHCAGSRTKEIMVLLLFSYCGLIKKKKKVNQSRYRPGVAQRVPGS